MREDINKLGFGLRIHSEMAEDFSLEDPMETSLYTKEYKSFELLYNFCCKNGNKHFVYKVIMRNFDILIKLEELSQVVESFFIDDQEFGNDVTFGMTLPEEELPTYLNFKYTFWERSDKR